MDRHARLSAGAVALFAVAGVGIIAGCGPRPQAPPPVSPAAQPTRRAAADIEPQHVLAADRFQQLQTLRNDSTATVTVVLPLPARAGNALFTFTRVARPVSPDRLPNVLFARGESKDPPRVARITLTTADDLRLTIFDDTAVYIARVSPNRPFRYRRLTASKDADGRICSVTRRENNIALRRLNNVEASVASVDSALPRTLQIVIAIGPIMTRDNDDKIDLEEQVSDLLNIANEPLGRDVGVTLVQSGFLLHPSDGDLANPSTNDLLTNLQTFIQNTATAKNWPIDLGHMIEEDGGGRSDIGGFCTAGRNAKAWSGSSGTDVQLAFLNFVHEVGHQIGAAHTYNITDTFRDPLNAYEPGTGVSIMSIGNDIGPYYHANSMALIDQSLHDRTAEAGCGTESAVTTAAPVVRTPATDLFVPQGTPFEVEALPDMAPDQYRWDEYDLAPLADGAPPFFDSSAERSLTRIYPPLAQLLGAPSASTTWPRGSLKFRLLGFSGFSHKHHDITVHVENSQPFAITSVTCTAPPCPPGGQIDVTWTVANTTATPYHVETLRIELFEQGGSHKRYLIASGVPNTGHTTQIIPTSVPSVTGRLMLHAEGGIFFAVSTQITIQ
jgi:hypothetical protein